jgi:1,4-alpha-glucan branching enzyme
VWSLFLPDEKFGDALVHGSKVKVTVVAENSSTMDRIPAYIRRVVNENNSNHFVGQYWNPKEPFQWKNKNPRLNHGLRVYEAHVGMATEEYRVGTFAEFTEKVLPRIKDLEYNAVQLMAIQEHPYYGSFGYHVSNFYAVSSRFGTPEELKTLIDTAHGLGIVVLLDLVHSHSVKNTHEGLNLFDGTEFQYFHAGPRGQHVAWDSLLFDYSKFEVKRFLLSNVRYWLEEFRFDGFRFDGVTSMMYLDHGLGKAFSNYDDYFNSNIDRDAVLYLQLANTLAHAVKPDAITVAEDVSGMVGDLSHAAQPAARRKAHRLRRESRPVAGGGQDAGVLADGPGDVLEHVLRPPERGGRSRDRAAQDDSADHVFTSRRGVSEFHGQRVWSPGVG